MILAVTGHRPPKVGGYQTPNRVFEAIMRSMDEMFMRLMPTHVYTGMALGVDQWAADLCIVNSIPWTAVIPFEGYESRWPDESKEIYRRLMRQATTRRILAPEPPEGANVDVMIRNRNRYIVREAEALMAVWNGEAHSGTGQTITYATQLQRPIYMAQIRPQLWAEARTTYERLEARRDLQRAQQVAAVIHRRPQRAQEPPGRWSPEFRAEQEAFAHRFAGIADEANTVKKAEKAKEDVANLKPRRVIDIGED